MECPTGFIGKSRGASGSFKSNSQGVDIIRPFVNYNSRQKITAELISGYFL